MTLVSLVIPSELACTGGPPRSLFARFSAISLSDRVRRVGQARTIGAIHDESSLDQRRTHGLAVHAHPASDCPHRYTRTGEAHGLRLLVEPQPRPAARHVAATQMGEHGGAVDAVPLSERLDAHPGQVAADERVHLGGGEKSLSRLDSPHDRATIVLRSGSLGTPRDLVDPTIQAVDKGFRLGGGVAKRATQAPQWETRSD